MISTPIISNTLVEGTTIGAYRLHRRIGAGGMGEVWLAEHTALGRRAAIKVLHREFSTRAEIVTRFFNEARAATAISDPGIVQIFDFGQREDGSAYIVMELLDGEPLDARLQRLGMLSIRDSLRLMRQVATSLGAAHSRGIVHRDLKPENIFIVHDPEVPGGERAKLLDFGIAKLTGTQVGVKTQTAAMMGTPTYMSPEQCRGAGEVDQRSDVYALGCVLFKLVTGRPPFDADGAGELIAMHLREPAPRASGVPGPLADMIARCLAKDPDQRFASAAELATAISTLGPTMPGEQPMPAVRVPSHSMPTTLSSMAMEMPRRGSRNRLAFGGIGIAVAGAAIAYAAVRSGASTKLPAAPAAAPAEPPSTPPPQPPKSTDKTVATSAAIGRALRRFVEWSSTAGSAPCPSSRELAASLGDDHALDDAWGHPMAITCTQQPDDQIAGLISAGEDGVPGTADDIASWKLDVDVTSIVRGSRWVPKPIAKPFVSKPPKQASPRQPPPKQPTAAPIEVDDNGIPIRRSAR